MTGKELYMAETLYKLLLMSIEPTKNKNAKSCYRNQVMNWLGITQMPSFNEWKALVSRKMAQEDLNDMRGIANENELVLKPCHQADCFTKACRKVNKGESV